MDTDDLKYSLLDKIISVKDKALLEKVDAIIGNVDIEETEMKLSHAQCEMLVNSEEDIRNGNIIADEELNKEEDKWLKE